VLFHRGAGRRIDVEKYVAAILFMEVIKTIRNQFDHGMGKYQTLLLPSACRHIL